MIILYILYCYVGFQTLAPGMASFCFRTRDSSSLPLRQPTCTGSKGVLAHTGSVNCGWGSQIIFGFQLGDNLGSVSCKFNKGGRYMKTWTSPKAMKMWRCSIVCNAKNNNDTLVWSYYIKIQLTTAAIIHVYVYN